MAYLSGVLVGQLVAIGVRVGCGQDGGGEASGQQRLEPQVPDGNLAAVAVDVDLIAPQVAVDNRRVLAVQVVQTQQHLPMGVSTIT